VNVFGAFAGNSKTNKSANSLDFETNAGR